MSWECPACGRSFGRAQQSHMCAPAMSIDGYFAGRSPGDRAIFDAVFGAFEGVPGLVVEAVGVGILFKRARTFAELRPRRGGFTLSFWLSRNDASPRISRRVGRGGPRTCHFVALSTPTEVDEQVRAWLLESYDASPV